MAIFPRLDAPKKFTPQAIHSVQTIAHRFDAAVTKVRFLFEDTYVGLFVFNTHTPSQRLMFSSKAVLNPYNPNDKLVITVKVPIYMPSGTGGHEIGAYRYGSVNTFMNIDLSQQLGYDLQHKIICHIANTQIKVEKLRSLLTTFDKELLKQVVAKNGTLILGH